MSSILRERAAQRPDEIALSDLSHEASWSELAEFCERGVRAFDALIGDLGAPHRIALIARNSTETAIAYLVARHAGAALVPISFHLTSPEIRYILEDAAVGAVIHDASTSEAAVVAAAEAGVSRVFELGEGRGDSSFAQWVRCFEPGPVDLTRPAAANLLYTSGTTGFPKGVLHPHTLGGSVADYIAAHREPFDAGPFLTVGPLYHAGPLGSIRRLAGGRPLIVLERFDAENVLRVIEERSVTATTMVPTHFAHLLSLPADVRKRHDLTSLVNVDHTGSGCPPETKRAMIDWLGPVLVERYGGTESGTICTIDSDEWLAHPGSVGRPSERFEVHVLDDRLEPVAPGDVGQLYFEDRTGRGVRYEGADDKTAAAHIRPGVFTLGDRGFVDDDGYVFITGRAGELVVSGGVNLYPVEVERALHETDGVLDAAVFGVPDPVMGERLHALVVRSDPDLTTTELIQRLRSRLAGPKCPRTVDFVDALPRNPMGKLQRHLLALPPHLPGR